MVLLKEVYVPFLDEKGKGNSNKKKIPKRNLNMI